MKTMNTINLKTLTLSVLMSSAMMTGAFAMEDFPEWEETYTPAGQMIHSEEESAEESSKYNVYDIETRNKDYSKNVESLFNGKAYFEMLTESVGKDEFFAARTTQVSTDNDKITKCLKIKDHTINSIENLRNRMMDLFIKKTYVDLKGTYVRDHSGNKFVYEPDDNNIVAGKPLYSLRSEGRSFYFDLNEAVLGDNILNPGDKITASVFINYASVEDDVITSVVKTPPLHNVTVNKRALPTIPRGIEFK